MRPATRDSVSSVAAEAYEVLQHGSFLSAQVRLLVTGQRKSYAPEVQESIEREWECAGEEAERNGRELFNGKLFSLLRHEVKRGTLSLLLGETDFRELVGTYLTSSRGAPPPGRQSLADAVAVCTSLATTDGFLIVGRRSEKVYGGRGKLHVCAGHPDPDRLVKPEVLLSGENLLFAAMRNEIMEEFHIPRDRIARMICLGLIRSRGNLKPELIFETQIRLPSSEVSTLHETAKDRHEHQEVYSVRSDKETLTQFLKAHGKEFTDPGLAAMIFYGSNRGFWTPGGAS